MSQTIEILCPVAPVRAGDHPLAPRPESLRGRRVAFFQNGKPNADALLRRLEDLLRADGPSALVPWRKEDATSPEARIGELASCADAAVLAVGD